MWEYISFIPFVWLNEETPQQSIVLGYIKGTFTWLTVHFIIDCFFLQSQVHKSYDPNRLAAAPLPFLLGLPLFLGHPGLSYPTSPTLNDIFSPLRLFYLSSCPIFFVSHLPRPSLSGGVNLIFQWNKEFMTAYGQNVSLLSKHICKLIDTSIL